MVCGQKFSSDETFFKGPCFSDMKSSRSGNNLENKQMKRNIRRGHNIAQVYQHDEQL